MSGPVRRPRSGLGRFHFAIAGWGIGHERVKQLACCAGHLVDGAIESNLVCLGGPCKTTQLADELQRRSPDFLLCRRRSEVMKRLDIAAHGILANFECDTTIPAGCADPLALTSITERSEHLLQRSLLVAICP